MRLAVFILFSAVMFSAWAGPVDRSPNLELSYSTSCVAGNDYATFSFVGDILIHDLLYRAVVVGSQNFSQIWRPSEILIRKADFSVGNLEGPTAMGLDRKGRDHGDVGFIYDKIVYSGTNFSFNYHPRILQDLKSSGWDLLTNANNHSLDRGSLGIDRTIVAAREAGMPLVGVRHSAERNASFFRVMKVNKLNVAFLGCTEMSNRPDENKEQVLFCYRDAEKIIATIRELNQRADVDAIIVMPHWGSEYTPAPDYHQRKYARKFLEAGAVAIYGAHPHVLQPWEKYVTEDGRETLIAYSLGNFAAGQAGLEKRTGAVSYLGLTRKNQEKARIFGVGYTATYREEAEIHPASEGRFKEAADYAVKFFGTKNRINASEPLAQKLCTQTIERQRKQIWHQ